MVCFFSSRIVFVPVLCTKVPRPLKHYSFVSHISTSMLCFELRPDSSRRFGRAQCSACLVRYISKSIHSHSLELHIAQSVYSVYAGHTWQRVCTAMVVHVLWTTYRMLLKTDFPQMVSHQSTSATVLANKQQMVQVPPCCVTVLH